MASKVTRNGKYPTLDQGAQELFAAFPEPQGWALNWDGSALQAVKKTAVKTAAVDHTKRS